MGIDEVEWAAELQNNLLLYVSPNLDEELTIQYEVANSDGRIESFYCVIGATAKTSVEQLSQLMLSLVWIKKLQFDSSRGIDYRGSFFQRVTSIVW